MNFLNTRMNRATYWMCVAVVIVMMALFAVLSHDRPKISEVLLLLLCVPRLHDLGRTGWWIAAPLGVELLVVAAGAFISLDALLAAGGVVTLLFAGLLIWLGAIPGQPQANRFGEPPPPGVQFKRPEKTADSAPGD